MKEIDEAFFDLASSRTQKSQKSFNKEIEVIPEPTSKKIIGDYLIKETIGKGTFSVVKLGEHLKTKQKVAIKILDKGKIKTKEDLTRIQREIKILSMLDHPNIIKTYKISETPKKYYIIMEYCEGGELFDYIVEKERLDEFESSIFFYQLINALDYIHSKGIAHRDLKPENLLLSQKKKSIKIIDFGLSNFFETGVRGLETPCGSPSYASPEIIRGEIYNGFKIDIWASGIILYAMLCGYLPFDDDEEEEKEDKDDIKYFSQSNTNNKEEKTEDNEVLFQKILEGKIDFPDYLSDNAIDLIKKMLVIEPENRIEIEDVKKHKFYLTGKKNYLLYQKNKTEHEIHDNLNMNINYINNINDTNKSNNIINMSDNSNIIDKDKNIINSSEINSLDVSIIKPKIDMNSNKKNNNDIDNKDNNKDNNNIIKNTNLIKNEEIKNEMEEYEKKLFANYLKKVADIKKKNTISNKNKNKIRKEKENQNQNKKNLFINIMSSISNKNNNHKNFSHYKNNYTLNEIVLDFNPKQNQIESYKQITSTPLTQNYNYNNSFDYKINHNMPMIKLNPIKLKKLETNNNNMFSQNMNTINTINTMAFVQNKISKTKNKFLKEINHYLNNNSNNLEEKKEKEKNVKYPRISMSQRNQKNIQKPILPLIKNNIMGFGDKFSRHVLTEANNKSTRNKYKFEWNYSNRINFVDFRKNIQKNIGNINYKDKFKLSYPNSYKKYNISIFKGVH